MPTATRSSVSCWTINIAFRCASSRIVAFNTTEGWAREVTLDVADELRRRFADDDEVPVSVEKLLEMARR
jgi:hypothetical protein